MRGICALGDAPDRAHCRRFRCGDHCSSLAFSNSWPALHLLLGLLSFMHPETRSSPTWLLQWPLGNTDCFCFGRNLVGHLGSWSIRLAEREGKAFY